MRAKNSRDRKIIESFDFSFKKKSPVLASADKPFKKTKPKLKLKKDGSIDSIKDKKTKLPKLKRNASVEKEFAIPRNLSKKKLVKKLASQAKHI